MIAVDTKLIQNVKKEICKEKKKKWAFVSGMLPSFSKGEGVAVVYLTAFWVKSSLL